ncbi:MAG: SAM-dependent methyltransferase [Candidatus Limnocylindrales bacterium]
MDSGGGAHRPSSLPRPPPPDNEESALDTWKFYDITHRDHVVCNPSSVEKLDEIIGLLDLPPAPRVLDIACGKGEFLLRTAERYGGPDGREFSAVAVDLSPFVIRDLRESAAKRIPAAQIESLVLDGAAYRAEPASFDLASCIGASWTFGGHRQTIRAMAAAVKPGGKVLVGEPFWKRTPNPHYLAWSKLRADEFDSHEVNVEAGVAEGLVPWFAMVSSDADWDRYETLQWRAAARHAAAHPDDPDLPELTERVLKARTGYLRWGRETMGWALYLFARP